MYRERIELHNRDATDLLRSVIGRRASARDTLVYLDPPYFEKGANLYLNAYEADDHKRLAAFLSRPKPFNWVLTYDNTPAIVHLYRDFRQVPFDLSYSAYQRRLGNELLIHHRDLHLPRWSIPQVGAARADKR